MSRPAPEIRLSTKEKEILLRWMRSSKTEQRMVERARMILLASDGLSGKEIALKMGTRDARVSKWLRRFALERIAGLNDSARSAEKRRKYTSVTEKRILQALNEPVPAGYSRWNGRLLAEHLGDVSKDRVWRVMRKHDLHLERRQSWCVSTDPEFSRKAADVVGLYLNPPQNALVLCVDEKPCIQALERAQGWIRLPNGRALTGFAHEAFIGRWNQNAAPFEWTKQLPSVGLFHGILASSSPIPHQSVTAANTRPAATNHDNPIAGGQTSDRLNPARTSNPAAKRT
jgi:transposase